MGIEEIVGKAQSEDTLGFLAMGREIERLSEDEDLIAWRLAGLCIVLKKLEGAVRGS